MTLSAYKIFPLVRYPNHTYVSRADYEDRVQRCLKRGQIAFIHGKSRLGKTVLATHVVGDENDVITAEEFQSAEDFWEKVARQFGVADTISHSRSRTKGSEKSISWYAKVMAFFSAEAGAEGEIRKANTTTESSEMVRNELRPKIWTENSTV